MSVDWTSRPILCDGEVVCAAINLYQPLLPLRAQIAFRAQLVFNAWQAYACDGRQMSLDDMDRMEDFEIRLSDASLDEEAIRAIIDDFGDFIPQFLTTSAINVPQRALLWTRRDANKPMHGSGKAGRS